jgi:hypothetical protein
MAQHFYAGSPSPPGNPVSQRPAGSMFPIVRPIVADPETRIGHCSGSRTRPRLTGFQWIMPFKIGMIANPVFPIPALPHRLFTAPPAGRARNRARGRRQRRAEPAFDRVPAQGIIGITVRQGPQGMQMVGQYDHRLDPKGMMCHDRAESVAQQCERCRICRQHGNGLRSGMKILYIYNNL